MRMLRIILPLIFLIVVSCKKEAPEAPAEKVVIEIPDDADSSCLVDCWRAKGVYILHEGLFNMNNTTLAYLDTDSGTVDQTYFESVNSRGLGDTGNDLLAYGSKGYVTVNHSNKLEVFELSTGKTLAQIPLFAGLKGRSPRNMASYKNFILVACFDGTLGVIDTTLLQVDKFIKVGRNPEAVAVVGDKAFVSNSGGLDAPDYDSTVSVVDLISRKELSRINVGINLGNITADSQGDLYVIARGNYQDVSPKLYRIPFLDTIAIEVPGVEASGLIISEDVLYLTYYDFNSKVSNVSTYDAINEQLIESNFIDGKQFETLAAIGVDTTTNWVYCGDSHGFVNTGEVLVFDDKGQYQYRFESGLNPNSFAFNYNQLKTSIPNSKDDE